MYRHRQLHLWITDHDYGVLRTLANARQETLSAVIRRLIKSHQESVRGPVTLDAPSDRRECERADEPDRLEHPMPVQQSRHELANHGPAHARG